MTDKQLQRFLAKVDRSGECWQWTASVRRDGYGQFNLESEGGRKSHVKAAHRLAYLHFVGLVPEGKELDHLCHNRRCVNPQHLEPVTRSENIRRGDRPKQMAVMSRTEEHRARLREAWTRRRLTEQRKPFSADALERMAAVHRGKPLSEEHRAKLRAAWVRRKARTP